MFSSNDPTWWKVNRIVWGKKVCRSILSCAHIPWTFYECAYTNRMRTSVYHLLAKEKLLPQTQLPNILICEYNANSCPEFREPWMNFFSNCVHFIDFVLFSRSYCSFIMSFTFIHSILTTHNIGEIAWAHCFHSWKVKLNGRGRHFISPTTNTNNFLLMRLCTRIQLVHVSLFVFFYVPVWWSWLLCAPVCDYYVMLAVYEWNHLLFSLLLLFVLFLAFFRLCLHTLTTQCIGSFFF